MKSRSRPAEVAAGMTVTPRPRSARPVMLAESSAGPRSTTQRVCEPTASVSWRGQSTVSTQMAWARCSVRPASRPQASAQSRAMATAGASAGWWKPSATGHRLDGRAERTSAADLGLDLGGLGGAALVDGGAEAAQDGRGAADDEAARTVDGAHGGDVGGVGDLGDELLDLGEVGAADGQHGGVLAVRHQAGAAADDGGCGADEPGDGQQLDVAGGVAGRSGSPGVRRRRRRRGCPASGRPRPPERSG